MKVEKLAEALCAIRVCSDMGYQDTLEYVRRKFPSGTSSNWQEAPEILRDGSRREVVCADDPIRKHYVYEC